MMDWWARYVGLPFGDGPDAHNCWALVVQVYADQRGIALPSYGDVSATDLMRVAREIERGQARETWVAVDAPEPMDVVLMRSARGGRPVCHVGLILAPNLMLHTELGTAAVTVPLDHFTVRGRIAGYRRYVG